MPLSHGVVIGLLSASTIYMIGAVAVGVVMGFIGNRALRGPWERALNTGTGLMVAGLLLGLTILLYNAWNAALR